MSIEAVFLELAYNGIYLLLFGSYIFYYLPANLGPLSHISTLHVIPFYFVVGYFTDSMIRKQNKTGYGRALLTTILFYWMVIIAFVIV